MEAKYKIGELVVYEGLIGEIESVGDYSGQIGYGLVAILDKEQCCTAMEDECEPYNGEEIDQTEAYYQAVASSITIQSLGNRLTDKYFRDGNH